MSWTLICFGFWVTVGLLFTQGIMDDYIGRVCEAYCPQKLAKNQPPTVRVQPSDIIAAEFEQPWWEGGPAPR